MRGLKTGLVAGAAALFAAAPAFAADVPAPVAPVTVAPAVSAPVAAPRPALFDWSGAFVGGLAGFAWGDLDATAGATAVSTDADGVLGGLFAGYNFQVGAFVGGVEADIALGNVDADFTVPPGTDVTTETDYLATLRARAGFSWNQLLIYGAGGLALLGTETSDGTGTDTATFIGWTLGAGLEAQFGTNVVARAEYLYVDTGPEEISLPAAGTFTADVDAHIARVGIGYRF